MKKEISSQQAGVLAHLLEHGPFKPSARIVDYRFSQETGGSICVAIATVDVEDDQGIFAVFNLPSSDEKHILITITDGNPDDIAGIVARLADYARDHAIAFGHTLLLEKEERMQRAGRVATLLLRTDAIPALATLSNSVTINGFYYQMHLVVFLDEAEYRKKLSEGLVALLDSMESQGRDLVRFSAKLSS